MSGADVIALSDLATPWSIHVAATLDIASHIQSGTTGIAALARACGADRDALERVLRHLTQAGVFEEPRPGEFALNDAARALLEPSVRIGLDLNGIGGRMAHAWSSLPAAVRTGKPAYDTVFGRPFWEDLEAHPDIAASFDALMGVVGHGTPDPHVLIDGNWDAIHHVVDVGGGTGALLAEILRAHPHVRGTLVDLPQTIVRARAAFEAAGVADRVTFAAQSFFDALPERGDLYVLKNLLADWPDADALRLLRRCADAARPAGRLVIAGGVSEGDRPSPELLMLVLVGGTSRSLAEFTALARTAGLTVTASGRQPSGRFLVECRPQG